MSPDSKLIIESILKRDRSLTEEEKRVLQMALKGPVCGMAEPSIPHPAVTSPATLLSRAVVAEKLNVSVSTVERLEAAGDITPVYVTTDTPRFIADEIQNLIVRRKARAAHRGARGKATVAQ